MSSYDVFSVRGLYTSLGDGWTYLNAHDCPQIPERVSAAVARSFRLSTSVSATERTGNHASRSVAGTPEGSGFLQQARVAVADLVGASANCVVLGPSLPVLYLYLARAMRPMWRQGSSVVLSNLDSAELSTPFTLAGPEVRWAQPDLGTGELPEWQYRDLVDGSTRLVALSAAHGELGTVANVAQIAEEVQGKSRAWVLVDASAYAAYRPVDIVDWNVDIVAVDLAQLGGPQVSALVFRDPLMFKRLKPVTPRPDTVEGTAAMLESPVSTGLAGGVAPTVEHLAMMASSQGTRRARLEESMTALGDYLEPLRDDLYHQLGALPAVHIFGVSGEVADNANQNRLPRLTFAVKGVPAEMVQERLVDNGLVTSLAPHTPLMVDMGIDEVDGAVTVGLGPFNTSHDVNQLVRTVASLA
jgi:selenocysteine lyase/cysteine desulfurase